MRIFKPSASARNTGRQEHTHISSVPGFCRTAAIEAKKALPSLILVLVFGAAVLIFPKEASKGVKDGLMFCGNILIPSLFPFMVISALTVNSGVCKMLEKPLDKATRLLFRLPGYCGATIFLSLAGGFPVGARGISSLYREKIITEKQAEQMAYFCVCSGPGFLITFVGSNLYGSISAGLVLLGASVAAVIILGISAGFFSEKELQQMDTAKPEKRETDLALALTKSVSDAAKGIIEMCATVILFNVIISLEEIFIKSKALLTGFYILTEVTTACNELSGTVSLAAVAFAIGFGGLSVHFQVFQALGEIKVSKIRFFIFRALQGLLTALFAKIGFYFFPVAKAVFSTTENTTAVLSSSTFLGSFALIFTAVCFLYSLKNNN